jgi:hypothetical protein
LSKIQKGTWVEVERPLPSEGRRLLDRGPGPAKQAVETLRIAGFLLEDAELGQQVRVRTVTGKVFQGKLRIQSPGYGASFSHAVPELLKYGRDGQVRLVS